MRKIMGILVPGIGLLALWATMRGHGGDPLKKEDSAAVVRLRRPIGLLLVDDGKRLLVANRVSGTVSMLDTQTLKPIVETRVGRRLSDMAALPGQNAVLVTDEEAGEVVLLELRQDSLREKQRLKVGHGPVAVQVSETGAFAAVACLWPRRLAILDLAAARDKPVPPPAILDLLFAPRHMLALPGNRLLVADSFGGELALVNLRANHIESIRSLQVHNIRGLTLDRQRKGVLLTHQVLFPQGRTVPGDIRSGNVIANLIRRLSLDVVLDPRADLLRDDWLTQLGDVERGAGDPAGLAEINDGRFVVAFSGVNELAIGQPEKAIWARIAVGARPTALVVDAARRRAYVANTFSDSVSVVDLHAATLVAEVSLGRSPELRPEERGELLFYDARLSLDAWYSCHSCHTDGHTNGRLNDNPTDGSFGTPKRVPSLLGTRDTGPWAWSGRFADLESQVHQSVKSTMQGGALTAKQVADLTAFLRTLPPPPSLQAARGIGDAEAVKRGAKVFAREKCATCHTPPAYTSPKTYDVGLRDEVGGSHFNPPSLRGVSQGGPYFHDGRAATLEEVFTKHGHPSANFLVAHDVRDLVHFLGSL
jgi:YVTN family beta-propeller protein